MKLAEHGHDAYRTVERVRVNADGGRLFVSRSKDVFFHRRGLVTLPDAPAKAPRLRGGSAPADPARAIRD